MGSVVWFKALVAMAAAVTPGAQTAAPIAVDRTQLAAAVDYCVAVAEADMTDAPPIVEGPRDFQRLDGRYGAQRWVTGAPTSPGGIMVEPSDGRCSVYASKASESDVAALFEAREGYEPDNQEGTAYLRLFDGGGVRAYSRPVGGDGGVVLSVASRKNEPTQVSDMSVESAPIEALATGLAFCLAAGEAELLDLPPVDGPAHFAEEVGQYGQKSWAAGTPRAPRSVAISMNEAQCFILAHGFASDQVAAWMAEKTDYAVIEDRHHARQVRDGWVQIVWGDFKDDATLILVTTRKGEDRPDIL
jgi:hypothetical protein